MNARGIRLRLVNDEETGLPIDRAQLKGGVVRFWRWVDRSRHSEPDTHALEFTIPVGEITCERAVEPFQLPGSTDGVLQIDPHRDVFSAPEGVLFVQLVVGSLPERIYNVNPRPADWKPE